MERWQPKKTIMSVNRIQGHNVICQDVFKKPHGIGAAGRKGRPWPLPVDKLREKARDLWIKQKEGPGKKAV